MPLLFVYGYILPTDRHDRQQFVFLYMSKPYLSSACVPQKWLKQLEPSAFQRISLSCLNANL